MKKDVDENLVVGKDAWEVGARWKRRRRSRKMLYSDLHWCMH